jgi:hypothetical protein
MLTLLKLMMLIFFAPSELILPANELPLIEVIGLLETSLLEHNEHNVSGANRSRVPTKYPRKANFVQAVDIQEAVWERQFLDQVGAQVPVSIIIEHTTPS